MIILLLRAFDSSIFDFICKNYFVTSCAAVSTAKAERGPYAESIDNIINNLSFVLISSKISQAARKLDLAVPPNSSSIRLSAADINEARKTGPGRI